MHPHFSISACALDPATNYVQSFASYVKSNAPSWMVPYFEPGNEVWNTATTMTTLVSYHAFQYWGNYFDWDNWYGKVLSTTGQDLAAIFGIGNLDTTYEVLCGVQTAGPAWGPISSTNTYPRLTAPEYVAQAAAPQAGYLKVSATSPINYVSAMLPATYNSPSQRGQNYRT
jgi:hypothetical protein